MDHQIPYRPSPALSSRRLKNHDAHNARSQTKDTPKSINMHSIPSSRSSPVSCHIPSLYSSRFAPPVPSTSSRAPWHPTPPRTFPSTPCTCSPSPTLDQNELLKSPPCVSRSPSVPHSQPSSSPSRIRFATPCSTPHCVHPSPAALDLGPRPPTSPNHQTTVQSSRCSLACPLPSHATPRLPSHWPLYGPSLKSYNLLSLPTPFPLAHVLCLAPPPPSIWSL